jgi:hypothetical protein
MSFHHHNDKDETEINTGNRKYYSNTFTSTAVILRYISDPERTNRKTERPRKLACGTNSQGINKDDGMRFVGPPGVGIRIAHARIWGGPIREYRSGRTGSPSLNRTFRSDESFQRFPDSRRPGEGSGGTLVNCNRS